MESNRFHGLVDQSSGLKGMRWVYFHSQCVSGFIKNEIGYRVIKLVVFIKCVSNVEMIRVCSEIHTGQVFIKMYKNIYNKYNILRMLLKKKIRSYKEYYVNFFYFPGVFCLITGIDDFAYCRPGHGLSGSSRRELRVGKKAWGGEPPRKYIRCGLTGSGSVNYFFIIHKK